MHTGDLLLQILRRRGDARDGRERLNDRRFFDQHRLLDDNLALLAAAHERQHHRVGERRQRHEGHPKVLGHEREVDEVGGHPNDHVGAHVRDDISAPLFLCLSIISLKSI